MKELIEYQKKIKEWDNEKILDEMMSCYFWAKSRYSKEENLNKVLLLKMEIISRIK